MNDHYNTSYAKSVKILDLDPYMKVKLRPKTEKHSIIFKNLLQLVTARGQQKPVS
jgi:hypothetical protein